MTGTLAGALPHEPSLVTSDLQPIGGRIGSALEDFRVDEIPAYSPAGQGDHRYVRMEKRGLSTPELVSLVARAAQIPERDIGTAGLKDKHAVTTQWLSLPKRCRPSDAWQLPESVRILEESYHSNKLRTGHLHGNHFAIRLVEISPETPSRLLPLVERLRLGVLNAFAEQRFGRDGQNIRAALEWLKDPRQLRGPKARFLSKLYPSVIQSELFNRYLTQRLAAGLKQLLAGEIVRLEGSGASFVVEDLPAEQRRFESGELHPQGPMFGPKMRPAKDEALALEKRVEAELLLEAEQLEQLFTHAPGTRRDVMLRPLDLTAVIESAENPTSAEAMKPSVHLSFSLPAGSYATHLIRELTHAAWFEPKTRSPQAATGAETGLE
jgi:tRNA pseudouridine13 synthase